MRTIMEMIAAVRASDRGDWMALACVPACAGLLGLLCYGFAR